MLSPLRQYENQDQTFQRWEEIFAAQYANQFCEPQQQQFHASSNNELETIQEEDDEIQFIGEVEKQSSSGLMFNKRVLSLESESLCYYSKPKVVQDAKINTFKHQPKVRIALESITSVTVPANRPNCIKVEGFGPIILKKTTKKSAKFSYLFRFADLQLPTMWRNLILAAQDAKKSKSYIVTFENLLKHSRSSSLSSQNSSSQSSSSSSTSR